MKVMMPPCEVPTEHFSWPFLPDVPEWMMEDDDPCDRIAMYQ